MSVYKPKNSRHYHFDFQWKGHRFCGSTGQVTRRAAEQYEANERRKVTLGETAKPSITVDQAFGTWLAARGSAKRNVATDTGQAKAMIAAFGKTRAFDDLSIADFDKLIAGILGKGRSNATANRHVELARRVTRFIGSRGFATPEIKWGDLLLDEPKERVRELSADEERRLFDALDDNLKPLVRFGLMTGLRRTALVRLRWSDVDFGQARIVYGQKGGGEDYFPLTPAMIAHLADQPKAGPYVFTYVCERTSPKAPGRVARLKGHRYPFSLQGWMRKWRRALKDAGIDDYRFHDNRHTFGSRVTRASGNLKVTQRLMGHSDIKTTSRYVHALDADMRDALGAAESRSIPEAGVTALAETRRKQGKTSV